MLQLRSGCSGRASGRPPCRLNGILQEEGEGLGLWERASALVSGLLEHMASPDSDNFYEAAVREARASLAKDRRPVRTSSAPAETVRAIPCETGPQGRSEGQHMVLHAALSTCSASPDGLFRWVQPTLRGL